MPVIIITMFLMFIAAGYGWIMNIITLLHSDALTIAVIVRFIGIFFAPLGCLLGWF